MGFLTVSSLTQLPRIHPAREPDMEAPHAVRVGPEDGHTAAWRRCLGGEEGVAHSQVPAEHFSLNRSPSVWHAGGLQAMSGPLVHGTALNK